MSKKQYTDVPVNEDNEKWFNKIDELNIKLQDETISKREKKKIEKEIEQNKKYIIKSDFWMKKAESFEKNGEKLKSAGKSMQRAGLKTTAIVWTPALFAGYKVYQNIKGSKETPEQDLIELIKQCEKDYKNGKIDEQTMKEYIVKFTQEEYRS